MPKVIYSEEIFIIPVPPHHPLVNDPEVVQRYQEEISPDDDKARIAQAAEKAAKTYPGSNPGTLALACSSSFVDVYIGMR